MRIMILGGDGYLGWPTAMHLAMRGHEVVIVDDELKRILETTFESEPLRPIPQMGERCSLFERVTGHAITFHRCDISDDEGFSEIFREFMPDAVVHYAEQPSAPFSMQSNDSADLTITNNIGTTLSLIFAVKDHKPDCHIIKLGTMGEYGTPNIDIEEGYLDIEHNGRKDTFLYPRKPGSAYHLSKVMDTDMLYFYARTYGLRVTDLMQGPVYGYRTAETELHPDLNTSFHYDDIFGTVLNRFIVQAVAGVPLTVYGKGGQTRGYINIRDTLKCIELVANNPPEPGQMVIRNQFTEQFTIMDLAVMVARTAAFEGVGCEINNIPNPRKEMEDHYYNAKHQSLVDLGLKPELLSLDVLDDMFLFAMNHNKNINLDIIQPRVRWS